MGIGSKLTQLMKEQNTNANELARKAGVPATTIYSLIKRDSSRVDIDALIKIARALGVTSDYFSDDYIDNEKSNYSQISTILARNGKKLSAEEKNELIKILLSDD